MKFTEKTLSIIAGVVLLAAVLFTGFMMSINYNNTEISMREACVAQKDVVEIAHNEMKKTIAQIAETAKLSIDKQSEMYTGIMEGRYSAGDGSLMKWITESNPTMDMSIMNKLVNTIDQQNRKFTIAQTKMKSLMQELNTYIKKAPQRWFISNTTPFEYTVISSTYTKKVMETGKDDDIKLFE